MRSRGLNQAVQNLSHRNRSDITKYLADLNIKLQRKELLVQNKFECISAFILKLDLLLKQMEQKKIVLFTTLSSSLIKACRNSGPCQVVDLADKTSSGLQY